MQHFQSNTLLHAATSGVYTAIAALDVSCAWRFLKTYQEPSEGSLDDHLRSINQYWRDQLSAVEMIDTRAVRSYLIDNALLHDYLRLFAIHVAPVIVSMDLPQGLGPVEVPHYFRANPL